MSTKELVVYEPKQTKKRARTKRGKQTARSAAWKGQKGPNKFGHLEVTTPWGGGSLQWKGENNSGGVKGIMGVNSAVRSTLKPNFKMFESKGAKGEYCTILQGTDAIRPITIGTDKVVGTILFSVPISPVLLPKTRIAQLAPLWERFRFKKLEFIYTPIASSFNSGQILGFYDPDATAEWQNAEENFTRAASFAVNSPNQISQGQVWSIADPKFTNMFTNQTGIDPRLQQQGQFLIMANSSLVAASTPSLGNLYVRYEVELYSPQLGQDHEIEFVSLQTGPPGAGTNARPLGPDPTVETSPDMYNNMEWEDIGAALSSIRLKHCAEGGFLISLVSVSYTGTYTSSSVTPLLGVGTNVLNNEAFRDASGRAMMLTIFPITGPTVELNFAINGTPTFQDANWYLLSLPRKVVSQMSLGSIEKLLSDSLARVNKLEFEMRMMHKGKDATFLYSDAAPEQITSRTAIEGSSSRSTTCVKDLVDRADDSLCNEKSLCALCRSRV